MGERIWQMMTKEFIQIFRDPRLRAVILFMPLLQTIIFGYAINIDVYNVRVAIYDLDRSSASRAFTDSLVRSGYFSLVSPPEKDEDLARILDHGKASLVIQINAGFEQQLQGGNRAEVLMLIDGSDANTASIVQSYIARIIQQYSIEWIKDHPNSAVSLHALTRGVKLESRTWFNDTLVSRNFYIPGVIAILLTLVTLTMTSMSIVREKEIGTMEQLIVTPITRVQFVIGKTLPYILIGLFDVIGILLVSAYWFEVPIRGNLVLLFFAISLYLLTTLGLGLFVSTISNTQQEAMLSAFMMYFPLVLLSGFIFPIANMPAPIQWLSAINPLKHFLIIIRGIFLKGIGLGVLWPQMLALASIGAIVLWQATRRFHKTLGAIVITALGVLTGSDAQAGEALTLETCLEIALDDSPLARAADEGVNIAQGEVSKAEALFYPNIEARAHYNRFQTHAFLPTSPLFDNVPTFIGPTNDWQGGIAGKYLLYDNGRSRALLKAANSLHAQAREEAQKILHEIALRVSMAFYSLAAQMEIHNVSLLQLKRAEEHAKLAAERKEVGAIPRSDLLRIEVEVAESRQALAKSENDLRVATGNLNIAMGIPPETPLTIAPESKETRPIADDALEAAIATALTLRSEILAAKQHLHALAQNICANKSALGPKLTAQGCFGYRDIMFPPRDKDWLLGVALEWPLVVGQTAQAGVSQARAQWHKAQAELDQLRLQIRQQVWDAHSRLKAAYENIQTTSARLENARETVRLIEERYKTDAATTSDLLDTQAALSRAEAAFVESQWSYHLSHAIFVWSQGLR